ncbi:MAG: sugar phosphate isomerase/epimerase [Gammaproteobacteria bacterium]|nr:sugar phosphate isomerase/epimerase [Gammaproteobacteria bacterium]
MKIGIRAHDLYKGDIDSLFKSLKENGFNYTQLVTYKAIEGDDSILSLEKALKIKEVENKYKVEVAMLGAYFNPVHSNKTLVRSTVERFKSHLKYASLAGVKYVGSETGSYNDDKWTYNPKNRTEEGYLESYNVFKDLVLYAKDLDVNLAIEGAYGHVMYEPKRLLRLLNDLDKVAPGKVSIIVDLYNYLDISNHEKRYEIFDECLNLFKDRIVIFHLKDYIVKENKLVQVGLGEGLIDYSKIIPKIITNNPNAYLIFEGVLGDDIKKSKEYIERLIYGTK